MYRLLPIKIARRWLSTIQADQENPSAQGRVSFLNKTHNDQEDGRLAVMLLETVIIVAVVVVVGVVVVVVVVVDDDVCELLNKLITSLRSN